MQVNKHKQYQTILGHAAEVDREERPYLLISQPNPQENESVLVASSPAQIHEMVEASASAYGAYIIQTDERAKELDRGGMDSNEYHFLAGLSLLITKAMLTGTQEFRGKLTQLMAQNIKELYLKGKGIEEIVEAMKAAKGENTTKH